MRELGRGAMGDLYQARHNPTGRMVVLIVIAPGLPARKAPRIICRFHRERAPAILLIPLAGRAVSAARKGFGDAAACLYRAGRPLERGIHGQRFNYLR